MTATITTSRRLRVKELGSFVGVGGVAFVVQVGLLNLLVGRGIGPLTANALALVVSTAVSYLGNRYVSFSHRAGRRMGREATAFVVVNAATFALAEAMLASSYLFGAQHDRLVINVLNLAGIGVGTVLRFLAYRRFVFVARRPAGAGRPVEAAPVS